MKIKIYERKGFNRDFFNEIKNEIAEWKETARSTYGVLAIVSFMRRKYNKLLLATDKKGICGILLYVESYDIHIEYFATREKGFGKLIINHLMTIAKKGRKEIHLESVGRAKEFYKKIGMQQGMTKDCYVLPLEKIMRS